MPSSNMIHPKVLIVIPTYNRAHTILDTLNSVVSQTYPEWELAIIDNASDDNTNDIIKKHYGHNTKVNYHYFDKHVSLHKNWERAYQFINRRYKYFKYLCSDDFLDKNFLEDAVINLENSSDDYFAYTSNIIYIKNNQNYKYRKYGFFGMEKIASLYFKNYLGCPSAMLLKVNQLIDFTFYPNFDYAGDIFQSLVYYSKRKKIFFGGKYLTYFQTDQIGSETNKMYGSYKMVCDKKEMRASIIPLMYKGLPKLIAIFFSNIFFMLEFIFFSIYKLLNRLKNINVKNS